MKKKRKAAAHDFDATFLPKNRREQFSDLVKNRFSFFLRIGGLLLLGSVLFLLAYSAKYLLVLPAAQAALEQEDYLAFTHTNTLVFDGIYLIAFMPIGLTLGGVCRLIRLLAWGKGIFFWPDFWKGLRQNAKASSLLALLFGLFHGLNDFLFLAIPHPVFRYVPGGLGLSLLPLGMATLVVASLYSSSFVASLKGGLLVVAKSIGWVLLFLLFPFAWMTVSFIPYPVIRFLVDVVVIFALTPFVFVGWYLLCLNELDRTINHRDYPAYENMGLQGEFLKSTKED